MGMIPVEHLLIVIVDA